MGRTSHPGTLQLLNHLMGAPIDGELITHLEGCPSCQESLRVLAQERSNFDVFVHPRDSLDAFKQRRQEERQRGYEWLFRWVPAFGVAALLVVAVVAFLVVGTSTEPTVRLKGSFAVSVYVKRDTQVLQAPRSFMYKDGDKIRLGIASPAQGFVTVSSLEEGGFVPISSLRQLPVTAGQEVILPGSLLISCEGSAEALRIVLEEDTDGDGTADTTTASEIISFDCEDM